MTELTPGELADGAASSSGATPLEDGERYAATDRGASLVYDVSATPLDEDGHLSFDVLVESEQALMFDLVLREHESSSLSRRLLERTGAVTSEDAPAFRLIYQILPKCSARVRVPLELTEQNQWTLTREGAYLKPMAGGDMVDLDAVDELRVRLRHKPDGEVTWCQTPVVVSEREPDRLDSPHLPDGPLLDRFGQSTIHEWPGRTESQEELTRRLRQQSADADEATWPAEYSRWGGDASRSFEGTGFFRLERIDDRWLLVDPDGHPFWSSGVVGVRGCIKTTYEGIEEALDWIPDAEGKFADARTTVHCDDTHRDPPETVNFLAANFVRAFGPDDWYDHWRDIATSQLRQFGFNTVGADSEWRVASETGTPYVRTLRLRFPRTDTVYRDFPDVFADSFEADARELASKLEETADDPALVGYFLGNEPEWYMCAAADRTPAESLLRTSDACQTRAALAEFVRHEHDESLAEAWGVDATYDDLAEGVWEQELTPEARSDLEAFSSVIIDRFYETLSSACREVAPNHLNLGTRFLTPPEKWALRGVGHFDVLTVNTYARTLPDAYGQVSQLLEMPVLVSEWSAGTLDVGLPSCGLCEVPDQSARGDHFRSFHEGAAAKPWCIGSHYFRMYDLSAVGRTDGETYNSGLLDACHRPYEPLQSAIRRTHDRLYDVVGRRTEPFEAPSLDFQHWQ